MAADTFASPIASPSRQPGRAARVLVVVLAVVLSLIAVTALVTSQVSAQWLSDFAARLEPERTTRRIDIASAEQLLDRMFYLSLFWAASAALTVLLRKRIARALYDAIVALRDVWRRVRAFFVEEPGDARVVVGLTVLAAVLSALYMQQPMRFDEASTFRNFGTRPPFVALAYYNTTNNHVLHSVLMRLSTLVFGSEPFAIRLPAMLAALLTVPLLYVAARRWFDGRVALVATAVLAGSAGLVDLATNARGYSIMTAATAALLLLVRPVARQRAGAGFWFVVISVIGAWSVPVMIYPFTAVCCLTLVEARRIGGRAAVWRLAVLCVLVGVGTAFVYSPTVLSYGVSRANVMPGYDAREGLGSFLTANMVPDMAAVLRRCKYALTWFGQISTAGLPGVAAGLACVLAVIGALPGKRRRGFAIAVAFAVAFLFWTAVTRIVLPGWSMIFLLPAAVLLGGEGAVRVFDLVTRNRLHKATRGLAVGLAIVTAVLLVTSRYPHVERYVGYRDAPAAADYLYNRLEPQAAVMSSQFELVTVSYYLYEHLGQFARRHMVEAREPRYAPAVLRTRSSRPRVLYVIEVDERPYEDVDEQTLRELGYVRVGAHDLPESRIIRYELRA